MSIKGFSVSGVTNRYDYNYLDNKPEIHSIPTGGTAGQVLAKRSGADYAVEWADQTGGGGDITVDDVLSNTSENPVQNKVITAALATKADQAGIQQVIEDEVDDWLSAQAPSIGTLSYAAKQALLACFRHVAWIDNQGQSYYNALESELFPDATLESITAVFTQGSAVIYDTDSLDTLKQYLVVTANYSDSTTATVTDYTLSGTLNIGTNTITVSYGGKTDTFTVTVSEHWSYTINDLVKVVGPLSSITGADCGMALSPRTDSATYNRFRRSFVLPHGNTSVAITETTSDAIAQQTSNYYPIKVPTGSKTLTVTITPSSQYVQALTRYLNDGVYSAWTVDGPTGYNKGSVTKTYSAAGDNCYIFISTKYNNQGSSYPTEPTGLDVTFA